MSYLNLPRLTFAGDFQADVPTGNNDGGNFDLGHVTVDLGWNPGGSGAFRLLNCAVTDAVDNARPVSDSDVVRRARIDGSSNRPSAKIVDLDPAVQAPSELWGLRLEIVAGQTVLLAGDVEPVGFRDLWRRRARYQSVLRNLAWPAAGVSDFIDRLRAVTAEDFVSVRLTTFGYDGTSNSPRFTVGSIVGALGPYVPGEPHRFVAGRRFAPRSTNRAVNSFDGQSSRSGERLAVDLSNAVPINENTGAITDIGALQLAVLIKPDTREGAVVVEGVDFLGLGTDVPYTNPGWLTITGGLVDVEVPAATQSTIVNHPLAVVVVDHAGQQRVGIRETAGGWLVRADSEVHRAEPGDTVTTPVHVTRFGMPAAGVAVTATLDGPSAPAGTRDVVMVHPPDPTVPDGHTMLRFECADPGRPRGELDGQIYRIRFTAGSPPLTDLVTARVFSGHRTPSHPTWEQDVRPILAQYAKLYPVMTRQLIDLSEYADVEAHREVIQFALTLDIIDPNHMPVTRDLSHAKRTTILKWLAVPELPRGEPTAATQPGEPTEQADVAPSQAAAVDAPFVNKERFAQEYLTAIGYPEENEQ
jgi:hypothetical protein